MQSVFKAIADPTRRRILGLLAEREMSIGEVAEQFDISRPAIAKHLHILEAGDLIRVEPRGRERVNRLNPLPLRQVAEWLAFFDRYWDDKLDTLKTALEQYNDRDH
ncbi:ArsR/SmtB family transcription factor [Hyphobacterium sp.]|jgi:DNA-binding transcriptional ArsR family regulator|uniref:ArsR/SmtB family transcription factor n=1 Tax=Hyphobacterium sp. TaxID=2004662 RepID=UPI003BABF7AF